MVITRDIPDKLLFKIGEVARITGVKPHVLRYWESEFRMLRPQKTPTNQRLYRKRDVEQLLMIKQLLYQEGFTIAGANKRLRELARKKSSTPTNPRELLAHLRKDVLDILELVKDDD